MPADWKKFAELLIALLYRIKDAGGLIIAGMQLVIGRRMASQEGNCCPTYLVS